MAWLNRGRLNIFSLMFLSSLPGVTTFLMPFIFSSLLESHQINEKTATYATSGEIAMMALGALLVSFKLREFNAKYLSITFLVFILVFQVFTIYTNNISMLIISRMICGLGEGICMGIGFSILSRLKNNTKLISYCIGFTSLLSLISFKLTPFLQEFLHVKAVFYTLIIITLICFVFSLLIDNVQSISENKIQNGFGLNLTGFFFL